VTFSGFHRFIFGYLYFHPEPRCNQRKLRLVVDLIISVGRLLGNIKGTFCETNMHNPFIGFIQWGLFKCLWATIRR